MYNFLAIYTSIYTLEPGALIEKTFLYNTVSFQSKL